MGSEKSSKQRGRPKGTGKHQKDRTDEKYLEKLADYRLAHPLAKKATFIRQILGVKDPSYLRHIERGFNQNESQLLAAARERIQAQQNEAFIQQIKAGFKAFQAIREGINAFDHSPKGQEFRAFMSSFDRNIAQLMNSPQLQPWLVLSRSKIGQPQSDNQNPRLSNNASGD